MPQEPVPKSMQVARRVRRMSHLALVTLLAIVFAQFAVQRSDFFAGDTARAISVVATLMIVLAIFRVARAGVPRRFIGLLTVLLLSVVLGTISQFLPNSTLHTIATRSALVVSLIGAFAIVVNRVRSRGTAPGA